MSMGVQRVMDESVCSRKGKGHLTQRAVRRRVQHLLSIDFTILVHLIPHKAPKAKHYISFSSLGKSH